MGLGETGRIVDGVPIGINRKVSVLRSAFAALKWRVLDARTPSTSAERTPRGKLGSDCGAGRRNGKILVSQKHIFWPPRLDLSGPAGWQSAIPRSGNSTGVPLQAAVVFKYSHADEKYGEGRYHGQARRRAGRDQCCHRLTQHELAQSGLTKA